LSQLGTPNLPVLAAMNAKFPETQRQPAGRRWKLPSRSVRFESATMAK